MFWIKFCFESLSIQKCKQLVNNNVITCNYCIFRYLNLYIDTTYWCICNHINTCIYYSWSFLPMHQGHRAEFGDLQYCNPGVRKGVTVAASFGIADWSWSWILVQLLAFGKRMQVANGSLKQKLLLVEEDLKLDVITFTSVSWQLDTTARSKTSNQGCQLLRQGPMATGPWLGGSDDTEASPSGFDAWRRKGSSCRLVWCSFLVTLSLGSCDNSSPFAACGSSQFGWRKDCLQRGNTSSQRIQVLEANHLPLRAGTRNLAAGNDVSSLKYQCVGFINVYNLIVRVIFSLNWGHHGAPTCPNKSIKQVDIELHHWISRCSDVFAQERKLELDVVTYNDTCPQIFDQSLLFSIISRMRHVWLPLYIDIVLDPSWSCFYNDCCYSMISQVSQTFSDHIRTTKQTKTAAKVIQLGSCRGSWQTSLQVLTGLKLWVDGDGILKARIQRTSWNWSQY